MAGGDLVVATPEGLYCPAGDFHIDPWRPVPRAVITHGHGDHARAGMGCYHVVAEGLPILRWRLGEQDYRVHAAGERFRVGGATLSFHPAGHVLGSSQVRIEAGGEVWVASGDYKRDHDPTCTAFEVVPCDVFITESTFGLPVYRWPPASEVARDIVAWREECAANGEAAILYCYALGKAQRVLAELAARTAQYLRLGGERLRAGPDRAGRSLARRGPAGPAVRRGRAGGRPACEPQPGRARAPAVPRDRTGVGPAGAVAAGPCDPLAAPAAGLQRPAVRRAEPARSRAHAARAGRARSAGIAARSGAPALGARALRRPPAGAAAAARADAAGVPAVGRIDARPAQHRGLAHPR